MEQVMRTGACVSLYISAHLIFQQPEVVVENQLISNICVNDIVTHCYMDEKKKTDQVIGLKLFLLHVQKQHYEE